MGHGIDYGMGTTNIDHEAGIRFGVIHAGEVGQTWYDNSEPEYGPATCPKCGSELESYDSDVHDDYTPGRDRSCCADWACTGCQAYYDSDMVFGDEAQYHDYKGDGYEARQGGDDCDVFITKAPYYTRAAYCSPCAPGACSLSTPCDDGDKAYCFGHDWFEDGTAPYPVYEVATGKLVIGGGK